MNIKDFNYSDYKISHHCIQNLVHSFETDWYLACLDLMFHI